jgi:hypothetical protein
VYSVLDEEKEVDDNNIVIFFRLLVLEENSRKLFASFLVYVADWDLRPISCV